MSKLGTVEHGAYQGGLRQEVEFSSFSRIQGTVYPPQNSFHDLYTELVSNGQVYMPTHHNPAFCS